MLFYWLQGVHLLCVQCILPGIESRTELAASQSETVSYPFWGKKIMTKKQKKQPHCSMVDCLWLETVSCVTLSLTRKDDAIANDFWCNTTEHVASHTKIDFGLKLLATTVCWGSLVRLFLWLTQDDAALCLQQMAPNVLVPAIHC